MKSATRNSEFDAYQRLSEILNNSRDNLNGLFKKLNSPALDATDVAFVHEFVKVMKPVAKALDILQGSKDLYFGFLLPTIFCIEKHRGIEVILRTAIHSSMQLLKVLKNEFGHILQTRDICWPLSLYQNF